MKNVKIFLTDFFKFYFSILVESFYIALSVIAGTLRVIHMSIERVVIPTLQQALEIFSHCMIVLYYEIILILSALLIKISEICMKISNTLHNQAYYIQKRYRWL